MQKYLLGLEYKNRRCVMKKSWVLSFAFVLLLAVIFSGCENSNLEKFVDEKEKTYEKNKDKNSIVTTEYSLSGDNMVVYTHTFKKGEDIAFNESYFKSLKTDKNYKALFDKDLNRLKDIGIKDPVIKVVYKNNDEKVLFSEKYQE
jgi:hypothetical protein